MATAENNLHVYLAKLDDNPILIDSRNIAEDVSSAVWVWGLFFVNVASQYVQL